MATTTSNRRRSKPADTTTENVTGTEPAPTGSDDTTPAEPAGQTTPTAPAAATGPDPYVMIVVGVLNSKPEGITGPDLVKLSGLQPGAVAKVLAAMEISGAARRQPPTEPDGFERWTRGEGDPSAMNVANLPTHCVCNHCGNQHRRQITVTIGGRRGGGGLNGDGNRRFKKGELEAIVRDFVRHPEHAGHQFSDGDIAKELTARLNRKVHPGAVYVARGNLVTKGELVYANPSDPHDQRVTAPATAPAEPAAA